MVDMVLLVFPAFPFYRRGGWSQSFALKIFVSFSLGGGGGRCFSAPWLDTLRFGTQSPKSSWPLSFSHPESQRLNRSVFNTQMQLNRKR